ncbi:hypothetical protein BC940DRAFT_349139 [Gongronella butleri]|nr:hypothetical protein BC940DRAFT_349139 [Gongronella butleri]
MLAAWIKKLTWTMGKSRWQSRYFVLLDTELRYYKDEHATTPSAIISLMDIERVEVVCVAGCRYCVRLCPSGTSVRKGKPLVMRFDAAIELSTWFHAIQAKRPVKKTIAMPPACLASSFAPSMSSSMLDLHAEAPTAAPNVRRRPPRPAKSLTRRRGIVLSTLSLADANNKQQMPCNASMIALGNTYTSPWASSTISSFTHDHDALHTPSSVPCYAVSPPTPVSPTSFMDQDASNSLHGPKPRESRPASPCSAFNQSTSTVAL